MIPKGYAPTSKVYWSFSYDFPEWAFAQEERVSVIDGSVRRVCTAQLDRNAARCEEFYSAAAEFFARLAHCAAYREARYSGFLLTAPELRGAIPQEIRELAMEYWEHDPSEDRFWDPVEPKGLGWWEWAAGHFVPAARWAVAREAFAAVREAAR